MADLNAGTISASLKLQDDGFTIGLKKAIENATGTQKALMAMGVAATAVSAAVAVMVQQSADYTDKLGKQAQMIGMTTEQLSSYALAASLSDLSTEEFGKSVSLLSRKMVDAASGNEQAQATFKQLGLSVTDASGRLKTSDKMLEEIATSFAGAKDGAVKTAAAMDLMGKSGASMIPLLNGGAEEIKNIRKEAEEMGLVFSEKVFRAAERFNDDQTRIAEAAKGFRQQISATIIDLVNESGAFNMVSDAIKNLTQWWMSLDEDTRKTIVKTGSLVLAMTLVAGAIATITVAATAAAPAIAAAVAAAGPLILTGMAIAGVALLIIQNWNKVAAAAPIAFEPIKQAIVPIVNGLKDMMKEVEKTKNIKFTGFENFGKAIAENFAYAGSQIGTTIAQMEQAAKLAKSSAELLNYIARIPTSSQDLNLIAGKYAEMTAARDEMLRLERDRETAAVAVARRAGIAWQSTQNANAAIKETNKNLKDLQVQAEASKLKIDELAKAVSDAADKVAASKLKLKNGFWESFIKMDPTIEGLIGLTGEQLGKSLAQRFSKGTSEEMKLAEAALARSISMVLSSALKTAQQITDNRNTIIQNNIRTTQNQLSLFSDIYNNNLTKQHEKEMEQLREAEDAKLDILRQSLDFKLGLIDEEFYAKQQALKAEMEAEKARIDMMTQMRIEEAETRSIDEEEKLNAVRTIQEDDLRQKKEIEEQYQNDLDALRQNVNSRTQIQARENANIMEKAKAESDSRMKAMEEKQLLEKKDIAKRTAALRFTLELAGFAATQRAARASAQTQFGAAIMSAVLAGLQIAAALPIIGIPLGIAATAMLSGIAAMGFKSSMAAIASTPPPMPTSDMFAEAGGMLPGPRHSQGGVNVNAEGGEFIMPRGPAMANLQTLENMRQGRNTGNGININFYGNLDPAGRSIESVGRELGMSVRSYL